MLDVNETGDDIDLERELIDHESNERLTAHAGDTTSIDATPSGWPRGRHDPTRHAADNGTEPIRRTSRAIADAVADIAAGHADGQYPTIESIYRRRPGGQWQPTTSPAAAPDRQDAGKSSAPAPDSGRVSVQVVLPEQPLTAIIAVAALCFSLLTAMMVIYANLIK